MRRHRNDDELHELLAEELISTLKDRRRRRLAHRRLLPGARRELFRELRAIRAFENRLQRSRYPEVREALAELLEEAQDRGMTAGELAGLLTRSKETPFFERFADPSSYRKILPILVLLLTLLAVPSVREKVRPLLKKTMAEGLELSERFKTTLARLGEDLEDIIAEAQFNRLKESLEPEAGE